MQRATCKWEGEREQARLTQRLWYRRQLGCSLCYALSLCYSLRHLLLLLFCVLLWSTPPAAALLDDNYVICLAPFQWKSFAAVGRIGKRIITVFSPLQQVWLLPNCIHIHVQSTYLWYVCVWMQLRKQSQENVHRTKTATMLMLTYINILCTKGFVRDSGRS